MIGEAGDSGRRWLEMVINIPRNPKYNTGEEKKKQVRNEKNTTRQGGDFFHSGDSRNWREHLAKRTFFCPQRYNTNGLRVLLFHDSGNPR